MKIRLANPTDISQCADWMALNLPVNDAEVHSLIDTVMLVAEDEEGPVCYIPIKKALLLESLAMNPAANRVRRTRGLIALMETLEQEKGDIMYLTRGNTRLDSLASTAGFEELPSSRILAS